MRCSRGEYEEGREGRGRERDGLDEIREGEMIMGCEKRAVQYCDVK